MALLDTPDDAQASSEGDGQDSSEPPNRDRKPFIASPPESEHRNGVAMPVTSAKFLGKNSQPRPLTNGHASPMQPKSSSTPASPELSSHFRELGNSHRDLQPLVVPPPSSIQVGASRSTTTSTTPSPTSSPSPSESNLWSPPPTAPPSRPPSQAPSRAPSMSGAKPDLSSLFSSPVLPKGSKKDRSVPVTPVDASPVPRSNDGGHKFNLKDLLGSAPKLSRRSSARSSASSRKSDSEGGPKSTAGESVGLLKKYGTCERVAIGKGATSVVRLAHKWDRSEEKLYAVKVIILWVLPDFWLILR
jgi:protein-serine/threonine kinase